MKTKTILISTFVFVTLLLGAKSFNIFPGINHKTGGTDYQSAKQVSWQDFEALTSGYAAAHASQTLGGNISKADLQKLINSMPASSQMVAFRFCTDPEFNKVSIALRGAKTPEQPLSELKCLRNGGSPDAFCPTICDAAEASSTTVLELSVEEFESLAGAYQSANPNLTHGGRIDKSALQNIINSSSASAKNIAFRFCTDPTFNKTSVIFAGGTTNQPENKVLYLRNGASSASFCPVQCNMD